MNRTRTTTALKLAAVGAALAALPVMVVPAAGDDDRFSNPAAISVPLPFDFPGGGQPAGFGPPWKADPYPSTIVVTGLTGTVTDVDVGLVGLTCPAPNLAGTTTAYPEDNDVLVVAPGGRNLMVMSDVGGDDNTAQALNGVNLTIDDQAAEPLPADTAFASGAFKPTDDDDDVGQGPTDIDSFSNHTAQTPPEKQFDGPTPSGATTLAAFNGMDPNGTWSLYLVDDVGGPERCLFSGGWSLDITTTQAGGATTVLGETTTTAAGATTTTTPGPATSTASLGATTTTGPAGLATTTTGVAALGGSRQPTTTLAQTASITPSPAVRGTVQERNRSAASGRDTRSLAASGFPAAALAGGALALVAVGAVLVRWPTKKPGRG